MRQPLIALLAMASLAISTMAAAQVQTPSSAPKAYKCGLHSPPYSVPCSTDTDCTAKAEAHMCQAHGQCGTGGGETTPPARMMPFPLAMGLLGFLGGDLVVYTETGNKMNTTFGWGGLSAGSVLVLAVNSGNMRRPKPA